MSVWFRKISEEEFSRFGVKFWFREWRYTAANHMRQCVYDCWHEWYDVRNWVALVLVPVAVIISPVQLRSYILQNRRDRGCKGMTINHRKNIDDLNAARAADQPTKPAI